MPNSHSFGNMRKTFIDCLERYEGIVNFSGIVKECKSAKDDLYQKAVNETIEMLAILEKQVQQLDLFSLNEDIDDIATCNLPFILIAALESQLVSRLTVKPSISHSDSENRLGFVERSLRKAKSFIFDAEHYGFVGKEDKDLLEKGQKASLNREQKIQRHREEKELESKIKIWRERTRGKLILLQGDEEMLDEDAIDEEDYRDFMQSWISLMVRQSIDHILSLEIERELLLSFKSSNIVINSDDDRNREKNNEPLKMTTITGEDVRKLSGSGPIVFDGKRHEFMKQVFQPGYNLPTMTLDEFVELERQRGNIITGGGKVPTPLDQDDEKMAEKENQENTDDPIYWKEKRMEDEWKEDNPRGIGNRYNRS